MYIQVHVVLGFTFSVRNSLAYRAETEVTRIYFFGPLKCFFFRKTKNEDFGFNFVGRPPSDVITVRHLTQVFVCPKLF